MVSFPLMCWYCNNIRQRLFPLPSLRATVSSPCVHMFSVAVKTSSVTLTLIGLARSCGQGCGKVHFYIMYFFLCERDVF